MSAETTMPVAMTTPKMTPARLLEVRRFLADSALLDSRLRGDELLLLTVIALVIEPGDDGSITDDEMDAAAADPVIMRLADVQIKRARRELAAGPSPD